MMNTLSRPGKGTRLSAAGIKKAPPGKHYDDHGLFLLVKPTGARSWVQRTTVRGKRRDIGLGAWPYVTLAEARHLAYENRRAARRGDDPLAAAKRARAVPTFREAAEAVIGLYGPTWKSPGKTAGLWRATLETYVHPVIGEKPVANIDTADVLGILSPIWASKPETARKVRQRIGAVMKWAIAERHRSDDPTGEAISKALPRAPARTHHRALPHAEVAAAVEAVRASDALIATRLAFEFLVLAAARSGEVRLAEWSEIDMDAAVWTVPAERMKAGREHRVPLSDRALAVLAEAREIADGSGLIFPSATGRAMSDSTISKMIRELGIKAVPHGFRSSFRDWAGETGESREVAEAALAHRLPDRTEAAYARSDLFDRRRDVMNAWAAFLTDPDAR